MNISKDVVLKCLYFGCWSPDQTGHYLYEKNGFTVSRQKHPLPTDNISFLDGLFKSREQSRAHYMAIPGWTIMWMYDCSGDRRPGSNSAFLIPLDKLSFQDALEYAKAAFPKQVDRIEKLAPIKSW